MKANFAFFCALAAAAALYFACAAPPVDPSHSAADSIPAQTDTARPQPPPPPPPASPYTAIDLGTLDGTWSRATAINSNGMIVGTFGGFQDRAGVQAFVYVNGVMRRLPGGAGTEAHFISDAGKIAGRGEVSGDLLVWASPAASPQRSPLGRDDTRLIDINDRGDVVVITENPAGHGLAYVLRDGVLQPLGGLAGPTPGLLSTRALAVNARGQIVGSSRVGVYGTGNDVHHPFIWENGVMRDLGVLEHYQCDDPPVDCANGGAVDINARGTVVGFSTGAAGIPRAVVWENGVMRDLGVFPGEATFAEAINDRGQILGSGQRGWFVWEGEGGTTRTVIARGYVWDFGEQGEAVGEMRGADGTVHAFIWQDGVLTDLGPGVAKAINAQGEIIGERDDRAILWRK